MRVPYISRRQKDVGVVYKLIISCKLARTASRCLTILITRMKLFKRNWIALVIFSTDFRLFDDSISFYTDRVFRHSPRTTTVGYLCLPERRIGTRTTGCARLIRESKLSCIIHYSPFLFLPPPSLSLALSTAFPRRLLNRELLEFSLSLLKGKFIALMAFTLRRKVRGVQGDQCSDPENAPPRTVKHIWYANRYVHSNICHDGYLDVTNCCY